MGDNRPDFAAPHWLVQLLRSKPASIPWATVVRASIALAVPLAVGFALGDIRTGAFISTGALPVVLAEAAGPYRYRLRRLGGAGIAALFGYTLGLLVGGESAISIPTVVLIAGLSALISTAGSNASVASLQLFVFCVLGVGQHAMGVQLHVALVYFAIGVGWSLAVALAGWTVNATSPERLAVAQVYIELAALLSAHDRETARAARHQLTTALNTAYDRLLTARSWLSGRDQTYRRLLTTLAAGTPAVEASVALIARRGRAPDEVVEYLITVAAAILADQPIPPALLESEAPDSARNAQFAPLYAGLAKISAGTERQRRSPQGLVAWLKQWRDSVISGPLTWLAALRLSVCVFLAEMASLLLPFERSYWITLTVGLVLKPDFGSVFGRAILRGLGTVVGVGIGAVLIGFGVQGWPLILLIAFFAAGMVIGKTRNYGLLSVFVTPLILLQMDLLNPGDNGVALTRLVDTVLGCALVLIFGYLLWPGSMRPRVGGLLADTMETVANYVAAIPVDLSKAVGEDKADRSRARRRAYRALADVRTAFQQVVVEPSAAGRQAIAWWPAIAALEQVADAVTEVAVSMELSAELGADAPTPADIELVEAGLRELATAVREQREPQDLTLPETDQLAGVVGRLRAVVDAIRGPDLEESSKKSRLRRLLPGSWNPAH